MSENSNDLGAFLAGFVIGGLVGAATAIILAPQSGADTRSQLMSKSNDLVQSGGDRYQQYREAATAYTGQYRDRATDALNSTKQQLEQATGHVQEQARIVLDKGRGVVSNTTESNSHNGDINGVEPTDSDAE